MGIDLTNHASREKKATVSAAAIDGGDVQALNKLSEQGKSVLFPSVRHS